MNERESSMKNVPEEHKKEKLKYPVASLFILAGYLLERFVYYGLFGGIVLYMQRVLDFSSSTASTLKALSEGLIYLAPIAGAILADSYFGKFRVVFVMCCVYVFGTIIFSLSGIPTLRMSTLGRQIVGIGGMLVFGLAAGLMKAVYSSLGPDQFIVPEQRRQQQRFFLAFYWMINAGAFAGQMLTAQLRSSIQCFGDDCYILPFGILSCLMLLSTLIFYSGKNRYREAQPDEMLINTFKCIFLACKKSLFHSSKPALHWIDRTKDKYDVKLRNDVKKSMRVLLLFVTFPLFWALFYQTSTGMIFQAKRLNGYVGSYKIPPEVTSSVNPLLILILIPLFEFVIYPFIEKKGYFRDTKTKMALGMTLSCISFLLYGAINLSVEQNILGTNQAELNIYNANNCSLSIFSIDFPNEINIKPESQFKISPIDIKETKSRFEMNFTCNEFFKKEEILLVEEHETTIVILPDKIIQHNPSKYYLKDKGAEAQVRITLENEDLLVSNGSIVSLVYGELTELFFIEEGLSNFRKLSPNHYVILKDEMILGQVEVRQDGVYDLVISNKQTHIFTMTIPSTTHIFWLIPQYLIITTGEVLFSVSGMDFAYSEAPSSMKSFMQAANLFTITIGLWLFALVTKLNDGTGLFEFRASNEAFSYAAAMAINTVIFILISRYYDKENEKDKNSGGVIGIENIAFEEK